MNGKYFQGWRLTAVIGLAVGAISSPVFVAYGINEESIHLFLRVTARCSTILFLMAFSASALVRLYPCQFTQWLARNRRYAGVGFAVSHTFHLSGILMLIRLKPDEFSNPAGMVTIIGGGLAFVFLYAMVATSFDRSEAWLGARKWKILHKTGMYFFWTIFFFDYVIPALESPVRFFFAILVMTAITVRILAWRKKRLRSAILNPQSSWSQSISHD